MVRRHFPPGAAVLDIGCGTGVPIAAGLAEDGFAVFGVDASPILLAEFRRNVPSAESACETAQDGAYFQRSFDGAVAIGLIFLLAEEDQKRVIARAAGALKAGGRFLFSAPREVFEWKDVLTGRQSRSLGAGVYERLLSSAGMRLADCGVDEGGSNYYDAAKPAA